MPSTVPANDQNASGGNSQRADNPSITTQTNSRKNGNTSGRGSKGATKQVLQDKNNELNSEVEKLTAQLKEAQQALADAEKAKQDAENAKAEAEARAQAANGVSQGLGGQEPATGSIPKPSDRELNKKGESNRLQKAMGLEGNDEYVRIQATIHDLCPRVGIDYSLRLSQQPTAVLAKLFKIARKRHPYLDRFQNDWATAQLVKQFLQNKRKQENRKRKGGDGGTTGRKRGRFDIADTDAEVANEDGEQNDGDEDLGSDGGDDE